jgi:hypothetical protein
MFVRVGYIAASAIVEIGLCGERRTAPATD